MLKEQAEREQHPYEAVWMMERLGVVYRDMGQMRQAYLLTREALQRLQRMGKERSLFGYIHLRLGEYHWTWNQFAEARTHLDTALQFARTWQHADIQITGHYQSTRIFLALGQKREAEQALGEMERLAQQNQWKHHQRLMMATRALIWLVQGNLAAASAWAAHNEVNPQASNTIDEEEYEEALALMRVFLALQRSTEALHLLIHLLARAEQNQNTWYMAPVLALQGAALHISGEDAQARLVALRLLQVAEPADYLRVYLDAGQPLQQVLQSLLNTTNIPPEHHDAQMLHASIRSLLAAFEQQESQRQVTHAEHPSPLQFQAVLPPFLSPLTTREREVLSLLAQGKTNQMIADHLVVSLATAKKHVANIRVPGTHTKGSSGLGLGLYIAHEIVTRHNGKIMLESRENQGTTFTVTLPLYEE